MKRKDETKKREKTMIMQHLEPASGHSLTLSDGLRCERDKLNHQDLIGKLDTYSKGKGNKQIVVKHGRKPHEQQKAGKPISK